MTGLDEDAMSQVTPETRQWIDETSDPRYRVILRQRLKQAKVTNVELAYKTGKSPSHISEVLRGHYPHHGAGHLPKGIWAATRCLMNNWQEETP